MHVCLNSFCREMHEKETLLATVNNCLEMIIYTRQTKPERSSHVCGYVGMFFSFLLIFWREKMLVVKCSKTAIEKSVHLAVCSHTQVIVLLHFNLVN